MNVAFPDALVPARRWQPEVERIGTRQAYVEALGGTLRAVADFGDEKLTVE